MTWVDTYRSLKAPVRPFVRGHWQNPVLAGAARMARRYLAIYENNDHDLRRNGEQEIVSRLRPFAPLVALDVGAYEGVWTDLVLRSLPDVVVYAFEPSPDVADALIDGVGMDERVRLHRFALSDSDGEATLYVHRAHGSLSSLVPSDPKWTIPVTVTTRRGDTVLHDLGIDSVDLLKIDAEGHDLRVLKGFARYLGEARIAVIQFEYNTWNIRSRAMLVDFYELLGPLGYRIGKVHPDGVAFADYDEVQENWIGPACVAVHRDHPRVLDALEARARRVRGRRADGGRSWTW